MTCKNIETPTIYEVQMSMYDYAAYDKHSFPSEGGKERMKKTKQKRENKGRYGKANIPKDCKKDKKQD